MKNSRHHDVGAKKPGSWVVETAYLDKLVPAARDDDGILGVGREADARDPVRVTVLGEGVLAIAKCVPKLDAAVTRARHDLTVVGREGNRKHVGAVADEAAGGGAAGEFPKAECLVPRG